MAATLTRVVPLVGRRATEEHFFTALITSSISRRRSDLIDPTPPI
ncbi:hypothetical protein [Streptomyces sp. HM190]|nr:hypothetical protein [Streptomyces sp. HM190]